MKFKIRNLFLTSDGWLYVMIALIWAKSLTMLSNAVLLRIPFLSYIGSYGAEILICISIVLAFSSIVSRLRISDFVFYFLILIVYLFQYVFFSKNVEQLSEYFILVFFFVVPSYFFGCLLDIRHIDRLLFVLSVLCIILSIYHSVIYTYNENKLIGSSEYFMGASYKLLPHVMYVFWYSYRKISIIGGLSFLGGIFMLFAYGTRGPIVLLMVFIFLYLVFVKKIFRNLWSIILASITFFLLVFYFNQIFLFLSQMTSVVGLSTRIFEYFLTDQIVDSSGRDVIADVLLREMKYMPIMGYGLFGTWRFVTIYAHNLYIDMVFSFGYILGVLLLFILAILLIKTYTRLNNSIEKGFLLLLFVDGILSLFISGMFLFKPPFFILIGYCVGRLRKTELPSL